MPAQPNGPTHMERYRAAEVVRYEKLLTERLGKPVTLL